MTVDMARLEEMCGMLRDGVPVTAAAAAVGIPDTTLFRWLAQADVPGDNQGVYQDIKARITKARAQGTVNLVQVLKSAAAGGELIERTTRISGNGDEFVGEKWAAPQPQAAMFLLERAFARDWARRQTVEITSVDGLLPEGHMNPDDGPADGVDRLLANLRFFKERKAIESGGSDDVEVEVVDDL